LQHPEEPEISFEEHRNVTRHGLRSRFGWLSPLLTHQTGRPCLKMGHIREVLRSKLYDVIHYHNISLLGPGILTLEPEHGRAIKIYTTHEHWLICPTHVLWKMNDRACDEPVCLPCTLMAKRPPQLWRYIGMLSRSSKYVDRFVSPSRFTAKVHAVRGFPRPVAHLPYFIARADRDWQQPEPRPQERPYFLFVGRLERIKGLHTLIEAWKRAPDYDLLVAGTGTQAKDLQAQASGDSRIKFLGALPQAELGSLYFHASGTIVPSLTSETFGLIVIESFARKTPVIVRDLGALPELVHDSGGGFVFRTDEELLEAVRQIGASPELRKGLGEMGYAAFVQLWSKEAHLKLYFDLLNEVAEAKFGFIPWK
jgi:glycosyltransferase involved in cell wall biosynthesis